MEWILNTLFYACLYGTVFKGIKFVVRTAIDIYQKRKASKQNSSTKTKKTRKSNPMDDFITSVSLPKRRKISPEGDTKDAKVRPASSGLNGFMESNEFQTAFSSIMSSDLGKQLTGMVEGMSRSKSSPSPPPTLRPKIKAKDDNTTNSDDDIKEEKDDGIKEEKEDSTTKKMNDIMNLIGKID